MTNFSSKSAGNLARLSKAFVQALTVALLTSCSDGASTKQASPEPSPPKTTEAPSDYSLKVFVERGGIERVVKVKPVGASTEPPAPSGASTERASAPPRREQAATEENLGSISQAATVSLPNGGVEDTDNDVVPGWTLLKWAAASCGLTGNYEQFTDWGAIVEPWSPPDYVYEGAPERNWYIFEDRPGTFRSCDAYVYREEQLLCTADRLAQVGDSAGTVYWDSREYVGSDSSGYPITDPIKITIPPQATKDKFIARDMALNALGHLSRLTLRKHKVKLSEPVNGEQYESRTCGEWLADVANTGEPQSIACPPQGTNWCSNGIFGWFTSKYFDFDLPSDQSEAGHFFNASVERRKELARRRLSRMANLMGAAARLTKDIVHRSVKDDIAGAQKAFASAGDRHGAALRAWGMEPGQEPYNNLRHAVRTLYGRLEAGPGGTSPLWEAHGPSLDDPRCDKSGTSAAMAFGTGSSASEMIDRIGWGMDGRWSDIAPTTRGETLALSLIGSAGVVFPTSAFLATDVPATVAAESMRAPIQTLLVRHAAQRAGKTYDAFKDTSEADAAKAALSKETVSDDELFFAVARVYDAFRVLTYSDVLLSGDAEDWTANLRTQADSAGLALRDSEDAPEIEALGGVVMVGPLPRADLTEDLTARLETPQILSNCGVIPEGSNSLERRAAALSPAAGDVTAMQNPFMLGDSLRRGMLWLESQLEGAEDLEATRKFLLTSAAETREWAGKGVVMREYDQANNIDRFYLIDITPEDLGVADDAELASRLVLTRTAFPYRASCLAGTRRLCSPSLFDEDSAAVYRPTSGILQDTSYPGDETYVRVIEFAHATNGRHLVLTAKDGKPGRILGAFRGTTRSNEMFAEVVSDFQHELLHRALGVGKEATPERTCASTPPLSLPRQYCIEGMTRDQFVPLANELTSSGSSSEDSWRHYLEVAKAAATKADDLAKEMLEVGLADDVRKEAASEDVAELCGTFPRDASATVVGAGAVQSTGDSAIDECLNPATVDVVFLSQDPLAAPGAGSSRNATIAQNNTRLCNAFCKDQAGVETPALPWCKTKCTAANQNANTASPDEITHAGLGLTEPVAVPNDDVDNLHHCTEMASHLVSGKLDFARFSSKVREDWVNQAAFASAVNQLTLVEGTDRSWYLQLGNKVLVQSPGSSSGCSALVYPDPGTAVTKKYKLGPNSTYAVDANGKKIVIEVPGLAPALFANSDTSNCNAGTRANVELAMFYLGAMAGGIPYGRVWMPVPAVNRTVAASPDAHPTTVYSASRFTNELSRWKFLGDGYDGYAGVSLADKEWVPSVGLAATPSAFFTDRVASSDGLPNLDWRRDIYTAAAAAATDAYLALPTTNSPIRFASNLVGGDDPNQGGNWTENNDRRFLGAWLEDVARHYNAHLDEAGATAARISQVAWQQVTAAERSACERAFVHPVFERQMNGSIRSFIATAPNSPPQPTPDQCGWGPGQDCLLGMSSASFAAFLASAQGESANMMETIGREGGPGWTSWVPGDASLQSRWNDGAESPWNLAHDRLLPSQCAPSERLELFLRTELGTNQEAMQTIVRALTLACTAEKSRHFGATLKVPPPHLASMEDLRYLENWLAVFSNAVKQVAGSLFIVNLPKQSLQSVLAGRVGVGAASQGEQGKLFLELEENLRDIGDSYRDMGTLFQQLAGEIRVARLQIEAAELQNQSEELKLALMSIENQRQLALSSAAESRKHLGRVFDVVRGLTELGGGVGTLVGTSSENPDDAGRRSAGTEVAMNGAYSLADTGASQLIDMNLTGDYQIMQDFGALIQKNIDAQSDTNTQIKNNGIAQVIAGLGLKTPGIFTGVSDALTEIKNKISDTEQNIISVHQNQSKAAIAIAKASGADFVQLNGRNVPLHVNTVYRRQFDVLKLRYERALESAKRAAYLARLAIEERLGVRLDDLKSPVGPLEAPSFWVDDLCTVQGVDYDKLRTATPGQDPSGAEEFDRIAGFADQFVGDYVAKLSEFVEFYNVENPFKESRDTAVFSLRESLGDADGRCVAESNNLLFYSDQLDQRLSASNFAQVGGWLTTGCSSTACLDVRPGTLLKSGADALPPPSSPGGATWLASIDKATAWAATSSQLPPSMVFQPVQLRAAGTYVLSWWDQGRKSDGSALADSAAPDSYPVRVYDSSWRVIASEKYLPSVSGWSERRELFVLPPADGTYFVAFAAADEDVAGANVAIANVQLEGGQSAAEATAYSRNLSSRMGVSSKCKADDPADFRSRFDYKCDEVGCFYELRDLLQIDTQLLQQGYSPLTGKVASGNYNYRLGSIAVNIVGTGLLDCAQAGLPSCYSTGYVEYDLTHRAQNVPMEDYDGRTRCFDFAIGAVRGGKALATERVLTLPLSQEDESLVGQASISKAELVGRPLSGTYTLRVREAPGLVWQRLEDIQLLVNYDYWSRVERTTGN
jgi:hypothetical protein